MRILFSFVGGTGHFLPLVPIVRAAERAGHTVAVTGGPRMTGTIRGAGFEALTTAGDPAPPENAVRPPESAVRPPDNAVRPPEGVRLPLAPLDRERERRDLVDRFIRGAARERAARVRAQAAGWRPDLIVCDEVDLGAMIAAERLGLPHATVVVLAAGSFLQAGYTADAVDEVRAEWGLPPDRGLDMLGRHLMLEPVPPGFRDPAFPLPATGRPIRPAERLLAPTVRHDRPLIYFTLGTEFNLESGDLFERVLAGLRELPADLVTTVGRSIDPAVLGPQPPHVRVERFVPQEELLHRCDLVVSHGGSGSVLGALAHGLPMLVVPMGADQPDNGARVAALGLGRVLDAETVTPEQVAAEATAVLAGAGVEAGAGAGAGAGHRAAALALRAAWESLPGPAEAVGMLEELV